MAHTYTQTDYTQADYTDADLARRGFAVPRDADAILAMAPLAAAFSVSPTPRSDVEPEARLVVVRLNGGVQMHIRWGPRVAATTPAHCVGALLEVLRRANAVRSTDGHACTDRNS